MKSLVTTALAAGALFAASPANAQILRYGGDAGATQRYVRTQHDHVVQTVNGQEQVSDIESYWRFATTMDAGEGEEVIVTVVHDSLAVGSMAQPEPPDFSALYDLPVQIRMTDRGEVAEIVQPDSLPEAVARLDLVTTYRSFFPVLPTGEAEPGTTWSDTTEVRTHQNGMDVTILRVNDYTVAGPETVDGREAIRVNFESAFEFDGSGSQQGAEISLSGSGEGEGRFFFQPEPGIYLGGDEEAGMTIDAFVTAGEQNLLIPIVQTRKETIEIAE